MKHIVIKFLLLFGAISFVYSCSYPHAVLRKKISSDGKKVLQIVYPYPKMSAYDIAFRDNRWAILFAINDYTSISFPPPGAIIDNRWFFYLGVVDQELNPLWEKPVLFENHKREGQNFIGQTFAVFPTQRGFLTVFFVKNAFFYMEFDINGKRIINKKKFYGNDRATGRRNRILSISYNNGYIYLFLLERPENMYRDKWSINLVKRNINGNNTEIMKKFVPNKDGWYRAKNMKVYHTGESIYLSWINGKVNRKNPKDRTYTLSASFYFARYLNRDKKCKIYNINVATDRYDRTFIRFIKHNNQISIAIRDSNNIWLQRIGENGEPQNHAVKANAKEKSLILPLFSRNKGFPFIVSIGSSK